MTRSQTKHPVYDGAAGFTLIEVLVALALTALLSASLATAVQTARRILAATERNATANEVLAAQGFLRSSIASTARFPVSAGHEDNLAFLGATSRLSLATNYVPKGLHQGLYRLDITLVPSRGGGNLFDLVAKERPARPVRPGVETAEPHVFSSIVIGGIGSARFSYFGKASRDATSETWLDEWPGDTTPSLVRLDVTFPAGDPRTWPPLLMHLEGSAE